MTNIHKYNLFHPQFKAEAYAIYATMREQDPVCLNVDWDGETPTWFITRYEDVKAVLKDNWRFVKHPRYTIPPQERPEPQPSYLEEVLNHQEPIPKPPQGAFLDHMIDADHADHTRLRSLVSKAFTP